MSIGTFTSLVQGGPSPTPASSESVARGQVAIAPASNDDSLSVVMPGFSLAYSYEVPADQWTSASNLPAAGAGCVIVFDEQGDAWVPIWEGMIPGGGDSGGNVDGGFPDSVYGGTQLIDGNGIAR
jgi:hypothetical protein